MSVSSASDGPRHAFAAAPAIDSAFASDVVDYMFDNWDRAGSRELLEIGKGDGILRYAKTLTGPDTGQYRYSELDSTAFLKEVDGKGGDGQVSKQELWQFVTSFEGLSYTSVAESAHARGYAPFGSHDVQLGVTALSRLNDFVNDKVKTREGTANGKPFLDGSRGALFAGSLVGGFGFQQARSDHIQAVIDADDTPLPPKRDPLPAAVEPKLDPRMRRRE